MVSILYDLLSFKNISTAPRVEKMSLKLSAKCVKRREILRWFQKGAELLCYAKGKKIEKNLIFRDVFGRKNFRALLDERVMHLFETSQRKVFTFFDTHCRKFLAIFFYSYKGPCYFFLG
jgi:hypothetical protein